MTKNKWDILFVSPCISIAFKSEFLILGVLTLENGITLSIRIHTPPPLEPLSHRAIVYGVLWSIWELSIFEHI